MFAASILVLSVFGLRLGIDFTGGSLLEVEYPYGRPDASILHEKLSGLDLGTVIIQETEGSGLILRFREVDEATHQKIIGILKGLDSLQEKKIDGPDLTAGPVIANPRPPESVVEKRFDAIGPTIGRELKARSLYAVMLVLSLIITYIAFAFRQVSKPVTSWKYGVIAVIALTHDVIIPTGVFAVLGRFWGIEVDTLFVTAVLTVLGFSVHDTIVVFDRIRENLKKNLIRIRGAEDFESLIERSVKETIVRSINTSFTAVLSLLAVLLFGGESVRYFTLTLILGIAVGTYSSIFIASPLLLTWYRWSDNN